MLMVDSDGYAVYTIDPFAGVINTVNINKNGLSTTGQSIPLQLMRVLLRSVNM